MKYFKKNEKTMNNFDLQTLGLEEQQKIYSFIAELIENKSKVHNECVTLQKFCDDYLLYIQNTYSEKYHDSVLTSTSHILNYFGTDRLLIDIGQLDIEKFKYLLQKSAPRGIDTYWRNYRAMFNIALDWGLIKDNPFTKVKIKKRQKTKQPILDKQEMELLIDHTPNPIHKDIFLFVYNTGLRLSEVTNLRVRNVIGESVLLGDEEVTTKNKQPRAIPMNSTAKRIAENNITNRSHSDFVFRKNDENPYNKDYLSACFRIAKEAAGLDPRLHFHSLRISFASNLAKLGVSLIVIQELLGHADLATTQIYLHTREEHLVDAVMKLDTL